MKFRSKFQTSKVEFAPKFESESNLFHLGWGTVTGVTATRYDGSYEVRPSVSGSVLETKDRLMVDDLTVSPIPVQTVQNISGGNTVTIGG